MEKIPRCVNKCEAVFVCLDNKCSQKNPFICASCLDNTCKKLHIKCLKKQWISFKQQIDESKNSNVQLKTLCTILESTIVKSIKQLQSELQNFKIWKSKYAISGEIQSLYEIIEQNREQMLMGKGLSKLLIDIQNKNADNLQFDEQKLRQKQKLISKLILETQKMLRNMYDDNKNSIIKSLQFEVNKSSYLQNTTLIKQYYLSDINKKISNIKQQIHSLELKCNFLNKNKGLIILLDQSHQILIQDVILI